VWSHRYSVNAGVTERKDDRRGGTREPEETARRLLDRYWEDFLGLEPLFATLVGDERFDDRLPDPSPEGLARRESVHRSALRALRGMERSALDLEVRTALDMLEAVARRDLAIVEHRLDRFWAVSHMFGSYLFGPSQLLGQLGMLQRVDTPERLDRYVARLVAVPRYLDAIGEVMREAVDAGQVVPAVVAERSIGLVERQVEADPETSPALEPLAEGGAADRERVTAALTDHVFPAYAGYVEALRDYRRSARETVGLGALPDGEGMYAAEILGWTTVPLDPQELQDLGRAELDRLREEGRGIASRLGFPDPAAAVAAHAAAGRNEAARDAVLRLVGEMVRGAWDAAPRFFGRLPKETCEVRAVPRDREGDVLDYYQGPTEDWSRPAVYWVNTAPRPRHSVATTTYHESIPGHHFETALSVEATGRHPIRRHGNELQGAAFGEGWGLYSERLADQMGLYRDDYERLGMLELQALRAARLVVDTGLHAFGWSREQAVAALADTGLPYWKAEAEADRYIAMPAQALSYKVGQMEIERWRGEASRRRGFRLSDFHDRLLGVGSLPLPALSRELEAAGEA
jgi:uncharacterized protein (DUF885 family)